MAASQASRPKAVIEKQPRKQHALKEQHKHAKHRAAIAEAIRKKWADPEYRERNLKGKSLNASVNSSKVSSSVSLTHVMPCLKIHRKGAVAVIALCMMKADLPYKAKTSDAGNASSVVLSILQCTLFSRDAQSVRKCVPITTRTPITEGPLLDSKSLRLETYSLLERSPYEDFFHERVYFTYCT